VFTFSEIKKAFLLIFHFFKMLGKAILMRDLNARVLLAKIYLDYLQKESPIPSRELKPSEPIFLSVSSHGLVDDRVIAEDRFIFQSGFELQSLLFLMKSVKPKFIFEIGTLNGGTSLHFFHNTQDDVRIVSLDISHRRLGSEIKLLSQQQSRLQLIEADSVPFDFSTYYKTIDFVFVDGGHDYRTVLSDSQNALKMLTEKGIAVWDDYNIDNDGVFQALNELSLKDPNFVRIRNTSFVVYCKHPSLQSLFVP